MWLRCKPCLGEGKARGEVWGGARPSAISGDSPKQKAGQLMAGFVVYTRRNWMFFLVLALFFCFFLFGFTFADNLNISSFWGFLFFYYFLFFFHYFDEM